MSDTLTRQPNRPLLQEPLPFDDHYQIEVERHIAATLRDNDITEHDLMQAHGFTPAHWERLATTSTGASNEELDAFAQAIGTDVSKLVWL